MMSSRPVQNSEDDDDEDELFYPHNHSSTSTGLVHLQSPGSYYQPGAISGSYDEEENYFTNTLMHEHATSDGSIGDEMSPCHQISGAALQSSRGRLGRQGSIVDGLLHEIYDRWHYGRSDSIDSDTLTECSSTSEFIFQSRYESGGYHSAIEKRHGGQLNRSFLQNQNETQLKRMLSDLQRSVAVMNIRLVKQLKRRDRRQAKLQRNFDIVTAILQAASLKRQIDTRMKFSIQPPPGQSAFDQWRDAMKAVCRLPMGMPPEFRKKVWLSLADHYLLQLKINWETTVRFVFNDRSNPDDEQLGMQIVKDLHRTGCSNFSGDDNDEDRAVLKRLLLAYARWNKRVGYCQGFNVIAALLLNVMDRKEDDALKVMIYLIDSVLPESYFSNNLRALSVDMAVFRDLLRLTYPKLSKHLDRLQMAAQDIRTGACYEPPLTNVFTMQWFLTLFATCLPVDIVLRVWDSILLEGSEILVRTALTIWGKLAKRIMGVSSADEFYSLMGELSSNMMQGCLFDGDTMVKSIYALGDFPLPHLNELREKYTYNIRPFSQPSGGNKKRGGRSVFKSLLNSDEEELDDDDIAAMACMPGDVSSSSSDISVLGPGVYGSGVDEGSSKSSPQMERMSTDIQSLKLQYQRLKQRQQQAHIIIAAASAKKAKPSASASLGAPGAPATALVPNIESPTAMNHLFVGKTSTGRNTRNRLVTDGPRISHPSHTHRNSGLLAKQLQAVASAQAVSKSKRMRTGISARSGATSSEEATSPSSTRAVSPVNPVGDKGTAVTAEAPKMAESPETEGETAEMSGTCQASQETEASSSSPSCQEEWKDKGISDSGYKEAEKADSPQREFKHPSSNSHILQKDTISTSHPQLSDLSSGTDLMTNVEVLSEHLQQKCQSSLQSGSTTFETSDQNTELPVSNNEAFTCSSNLLEESEMRNIEMKSAQNDEVLLQYLTNIAEDNSHSHAQESDTAQQNEEKCKSSGNVKTLSQDSSAVKCEIIVDKNCLHSSSDNVSQLETSGMTAKIVSENADVLTSCESILEDSGVDSPSVSSPMTTSGDKLCRQDRATDGSIDASSLEEDLILSVEQMSSEMTDPSGYHISLGSAQSIERLQGQCNTISSVRTNNIQDANEEDITESDKNIDCGANLSQCQSISQTSCNVTDNIEIEKSEEEYVGNYVRYDSTGSGNTSDEIFDVSEMLEAITNSSTSSGDLSRSSSVIETVPVPGTLDVIATGEEAADIENIHIRKSIIRKSSIGHKEEPESENVRIIKSHPARKTSHHAVAVSHKASSHSKRVRRFSSPARAEETTHSGSHMAGFPAVGKKTTRPFNPFPVRHFNANRAKTGLKLGLYSESTLEQMRGLKPRTASS